MRREVASAAQGGDVFAADFMLVPVYDTWHWSLLIMCYLGEDSWDAAARASGQCCRRATLIHLDSLRRATRGEAAFLRVSKHLGKGTGREVQL
jgi:Ulp1 family protease